LAASAYRLNHRHTTLWQRDICTVSGREILQKLKLKKGSLNLLAACPPCQGFSTMRTRNSGRAKKDPRNALIMQVLRLVRALRPKALMVENVPGLSTYRKFKEFLKGLDGLGYRYDYKVLNTAKYGVPQ